jgi:hypothetical protein
MLFLKYLRGLDNEDAKPTEELGHVRSTIFKGGSLEQAP